MHRREGSPLASGNGVGFYPHRVNFAELVSCILAPCPILQKTGRNVSLALCERNVVCCGAQHAQVYVRHEQVHFRMFCPQMHRIV